MKETIKEFLWQKTSHKHRKKREAGKRAGLHREVLALSHREQFEYFFSKKKNIQIVNTKNWLASSPARFPAGALFTVL